MAIKTFRKEMGSPEKAVEFARFVEGKVVNETAVEFKGAYSISRARYDVSSDKYKVYIHIRVFTEDPKRLTFTAKAETSKAAYDLARRKINEDKL